MLKSFQEQRGFTILETLTSLTILSFSVLAIFSLIHARLESLQSVKSRMVMEQLAYAKIFELKLWSINKAPLNGNINDEYQWVAKYETIPMMQPTDQAQFERLTVSISKIHIPDETISLSSTSLKNSAF